MHLIANKKIQKKEKVEKSKIRTRDV